MKHHREIGFLTIILNSGTDGQQKLIESACKQAQQLCQVLNKYNRLVLTFFTLYPRTGAPNCAKTQRASPPISVEILSSDLHTSLAVAGNLSTLQFSDTFSHNNMH
jgi:hypothetical protein